MKKFSDLNGSELWPEVIAHRIGPRIEADEMQKMAFALKLETLIPSVIKRTNLVNPDREVLRFMKEKAEILCETLETIRNESKKNIYIQDIIYFSLLHKSDRLDFDDIYWFADAFRGFLADGLQTVKSGKNAESELYICVCICLIYESCLGVSPTCRDQDYIKQTSDINDGSPYERVCMEINRRYGTGLTWSTMRKAKNIYKSYFKGKQEALDKL